MFRHRDGLGELLRAIGVKSFYPMLAAFGLTRLSALPITRTFQLRDQSYRSKVDHCGADRQSAQAV